MLSRWPIRYKLSLGVAMLCLIVAILSFSGFQGVYAYRQLARTISRRATELPLAAELTRSVSDLRVKLSHVRRLRDSQPTNVSSSIDRQMLREDFRAGFLNVQQALTRYREQLSLSQSLDRRIGDNSREREMVGRIEESLDRIATINRDEDWALDDVKVAALDEELESLQQLTDELPGHLQERMHAFAGEVRLQYRTWIVLTWITTVLAGVVLATLVVFFYRWVFRPLRVLIEGSRRVARGAFDHRIRLDTHDEVSELATAMNDVTTRFQEIRDDLDRQVQQRTKEVVRNEQLASVGFLAAGVAHEINNPLASIAWCAESLEARLHDILEEHDSQNADEQNEEVEVLAKYLRRIQEEAFRCKGITESLLDFSRTGDVKKQPTDLADLVEGVIEMVRHLGRYRQKEVVFSCQRPVTAQVGPQQFKQVILNLVTNALDSIEPGGTVWVEVKADGPAALLEVRDNGCGMTPEVLEHLFEPFFTRRRNGQGTGLGLSIAYRIVSDFGGTIEAESAGPGQGSRFVVSLPRVVHEKEYEKRLPAA